MTKTTRILISSLSLLLCLCLLCSVALLFTSCGGTGKVDLSAGYRVVYERGFNATLVACVKDFEQQVNGTFGVTLDKSATSDSEAVASEI